jgi:hypothetical protein
MRRSNYLDDRGCDELSAGLQVSVYSSGCGLAYVLTLCNMRVQMSLPGRKVTRKQECSTVTTHHSDSVAATGTHVE